MIKPFILFLILMLYFGCTRNNEKNTITHISCRLKWYHQSQFAGFYVAEEKGFLNEKNLSCVFHPGGQENNPIVLVASGSDDFAVVGADQVIIARSKNIPIVCIGVILKKSPVCFFWKKESGISSPFDFIGRKVAVQYGTNVQTEYIAMMNHLGIDRKQIVEIPTTYNLQAFYQDRVDVWNGYLFNEPYIASSQGYDINLIQPIDYGIHFYADCLITTETMIKTNPTIVRAFVQSIIEGWKYAINNKEESIQIVLKRNPQLKYEHESNMLNQMINLILSNENNLSNIGEMDRNVWEYMRSTLEEQNLLDDTFVKIEDVFTNKFLN